MTLAADAVTSADTGRSSDVGRLIVHGQDRPAVVAGVSAALTAAGANIVALDQYSTDPAGGRFFVVRVSHADSVRELARRGADVERSVLARAVGWHCEDRVLRDGNSTVVFAS